MQTFDQKKRYAAAVTLALLAVLGMHSPPPLQAQMSAAPAAPVLSTGVLPQAQVDRLLPPSVYFQGQTAPLQLRNAAAYRSASGGIVWASLVDTSGYSTGIRERYQFYLVTEQPLAFGGQNLPAGAYGGGFQSDGSALVMDLGGRDVTRTSFTNDAAFRRPRPLQLVEAEGSLRLYLGRQYVTLALK